ncbi:ComF family protein [Candidatus Saccharibacteria bacterium]|nr:ComF family protein [Candidatus Saccharibacteria bacterium]
MCGRDSQKYLPCKDCAADSALTGLYALGSYQAPLTKLVKGLKYHGTRQFAEDAAAALRRQVAVATESLPPLVTHVPTTNRRERQRSYDQAGLFAKAFASQTGLAHHSFLRRNGNIRQVGADRNGRFAQAETMFSARRGVQLAGRDVLLFDDVFTTGASMFRCARLLRDAGAGSVTGVVIARKDSVPAA